MTTLRQLLNIFAISLSLSGFATSPILASKANKSPNAAKVCEELISRIQVGGNYTYVWIKPSDESESRGSLGGAQALYEYRPANRFYGAGKLAWRQGDSDGSSEKRSLFYIDLQERLGYTFSWQQKDYLLSLFSGFGYKYLRQHIRPKASADVAFNSTFFPPFLTTATDLTLEYQEFYIPVGFLAEYAFHRCCSIGLYFTWMPQAFPMVDIKPLGNAFWALTNTWGNVLVELPVMFTLTHNRRCTLIVKPSYEYWQDGHSKAKTSTGIPLGLPGNTYHFAGVDINFGYSF